MIPTALELEELIKRFVSHHQKILEYKGNETAELPAALRKLLLHFLVSHALAVEGKKNMTLSAPIKLELATRIHELFPAEKIANYYSSEVKNNYIQRMIKYLRYADVPRASTKDSSLPNDDDDIDAGEDEDENDELSSILAQRSVPQASERMSEEEATNHWTNPSQVSDRKDQLERGVLLRTMIVYSYPYLNRDFSFKLFQIDALESLPSYGFKSDSYKQNWPQAIKTWLVLLKAPETLQNEDLDNQAAFVLCNIFSIINWKLCPTFKAYCSDIKNPADAQRYFCQMIQSVSSLEEWEKKIEKLTSEKVSASSLELEDIDHPMGSIEECIARVEKSNKKKSTKNNPPKQRVEKLAPYFFLSKRPTDLMFYVKFLDTQWVFRGENCIHDGLFAVLSFYYAVDSPFPLPISMAFEIIQQTLFGITTFAYASDAIQEECTRILNKYRETSQEILENEALNNEEQLMDVEYEDYERLDDSI